MTASHIGFVSIVLPTLKGHLLYQIWYSKHKSSDTGVLDVPKRSHDEIVLIRKER